MAAAGNAVGGTVVLDFGVRGDEIGLLF